MLIKRLLFAGDVFNALLQAGWDPNKAAEFLAAIPDVPRGKWIRTPISGTLVCPVCKKNTRPAGSNGALSVL